MFITHSLLYRHYIQFHASLITHTYNSVRKYLIHRNILYCITGRLNHVVLVYIYMCIWLPIVHHKVTSVHWWWWYLYSSPAFVTEGAISVIQILVFDKAAIPRHVLYPYWLLPIWHASITLIMSLTQQTLTGVYLERFQCFKNYCMYIWMKWNWIKNLVQWIVPI